MFLSGDSVEKSISMLIQVVGRIQFIVVVGLRSPFLADYWPGSSQLLNFLSHGPLHLQRQQKHIVSFSCFEFL